MEFVAHRNCPSENETDQRKKEARNDFDLWLVSATPELLDEDVSANGLVVHVPLNEGAGNEAKNLCSGPSTFESTGMSPGFRTASLDLRR